MKMLILICVLFATPLVSYAEWGNHSRHNTYNSHRQNNSHFWQGIQERQRKQASRIERGIDKGQLTRREIKKLKREQRHLAKEIRHYKRHNRLSYQDRHVLIERMDHVSDRIRGLKHNDRYVQNRRHKQGYSNYRTQAKGNHGNYISRDNHLSWVNNGSSAGFYFRF